MPLDLCKIFQTEESRYEAFMKMMYANVVIGILEMLFYDVKVVSIIAMLASIVFLYVEIYILWKSGLIKYLIRLFVGMYISIVIYSNFVGLKFDNGLVFALLLAIYINRKRWEFLKNRKRYLLYGLVLGVLMFGFIYAGSLLMLLRFSIKTFMIASIFLLLPVLATKFILKREMEKGIPFFEVVRLLNIVPITAGFCLFSLSTLIPAHFFNGNDITNIDSGLSPDVDINTTGGSVDVLAEDSIVNTTGGSVDVLAEDSIVNTIGGSVDVSLHNSGNDLINVNSDALSDNISTDIFKDAIGIGSPDFHVDPNILLKMSNSDESPIALMDSNGFQIMRLENGKIFGVDNNNSIGSYNFDKAVGRDIFYGREHNVLFSVDQNGQYFDANNMPLAKMDKLGAVDVIVKNDQSMVYKTLNGTIFDDKGHIVGSIKV